MVRKLKLKYDELLQGSNPESTSLTSGQMLLMGFNGLFTRYSRHLPRRPLAAGNISGDRLYMLMLRVFLFQA